MNGIKINPNILSWAINQYNLDSSVIIKRIGINEEKLEQWLQGDTHPSYKQLEKLAKIIHIPLGYFFLNNLPDTKPPIPDLRTVQNRISLSRDFYDVLYDALKKSDWLREYRQKNDYEPIRFIGKFSINDNINYIDIVNNIIKEFNLKEDFFNTISHTQDYLNFWVRKAEENYIVVLKNGVVGNNTTRKLRVNEFRGFAIADKYAPVIFINSNDSQSAQIFTLVHELAHLWIGQSGIFDMLEPNVRNNNKIEIFCNRISAELLMPYKYIKQFWNNKNTLEENLEILSKKFKTSKYSLLIRLYNLKYINDKEFESLDLQLKEAQTKIDSLPKSNKNRSGGDFYRTLYVRNSKMFTNELLNALRGGDILYKDVANLLNVKINMIEKIQRRL
ncbi:MAG: ImmA/IrrE family metallo-endopeptidase [bacterium]